MTAQGKGSTRRPQQVSDEVMLENWERIFPHNEWVVRPGDETIESSIVEHTFQLKGRSRATIKIVLDETLPDDMLIMKGKP